MRASLAAYFLAGAAMGPGGLAMGGQLTQAQIVAGLVWVPFAAIGYAAAAPVRRRRAPERMQRAVLGVCVITALSVIARVLLG